MLSTSQHRNEPPTGLAITNYAPTFRLAGDALVAQAHFRIPAATETLEITTFDAAGAPVTLHTAARDVPLPTEAAEDVANSRREARSAVGLRVQFSVEQTAEGARAGSGTALDISRSGMQLETVVPLHAGELISYTIKLPEGLVAGSGRLVRQVAKNQCGIEFDEMQADDTQRLDRYLATNPNNTETIAKASAAG